MVQVRCLMICVAILAISPAGIRAEERILVADGQSNYVIVIPSAPSPSEAYAAQELQTFLKAVTGAELPIQSEAKSSDRPQIHVGATELAIRTVGQEKLTELGDEGFAIRTDGANVIIAGGKLRGTLYGVYSFLEDAAGCRWFTPTVSRIPKKSTLIVGDLEVARQPHFEYRDIYFKSSGADARDPDWAVRNKVNGGTAVLDDRRGSYFQYGAYGHTFYRLLPVEKYLESHPEYFSLVKGKRQGGNDAGQLCISHPDVRRICIETLLTWIKEQPQKNIFSVSINDNWNRCECEDCKKLEADGNPTDATLDFVNAIAEEVGRQHPQILIEMLAYYYTSPAPKKTVPRPNVRVKLSPWVCKLHSFRDCQWNRIVSSFENIKKWKELTNDNLYIWEYTGAYSHLPLPNPDLRQFVDAVQVYREHGVKGVFVEGNDMPGNGGYMDELKIYLFAKALWNPDLDADAVIDDFMNGYFEKAAEPMKRWVLMLEDEAQRRKDVHANVWPEVEYQEFTGHAANKPRAYFPLMVPEMVVVADKLFDQAESLADRPEILKRVRHARMSLKYLKAMRKIETAGDYGTPKEKAAAWEAFEEFLQECRDDGIEYFGLTRTLDQSAAAIKAAFDR